MKKFILSFLFILFSSFCLAQPAITVVLNLTPTDVISIGDFSSEHPERSPILFTVYLTNDNQTRNLTVKYILFNNKYPDKAIVTGQKQFIQIPPLATQIFNNRQFDKYSINVPRELFSKAAQTMTLPEGIYTYKIFIYDDKGKLVASDEVETDIKNEISNIELISPGNPLNVNPEEVNTKNVIFQWFSNNATKYDFVLFKVINDQIKAEDIQKTFPIYEQQNITETRLLYPNYAKELEDGGVYAWKITSYYMNSQGEQKILSDFFWFRIKETGLKEEIPLINKMVVYPENIDINLPPSLDYKIFEQNAATLQQTTKIEQNDKYKPVQFSAYNILELSKKSAPLKCEWSVIPSEIGSIDQNGLFTPRMEGTTAIVAKYKKNDAYAIINIKKIQPFLIDLISSEKKYQQIDTNYLPPPTPYNITKEGNNTKIVIGPVKRYFSKSASNNNNKQDQNLPAKSDQILIDEASITGCADEGRVADIKISTSGPLTITQSSFSWTGPPCPSYSEEGRNPIIPALCVTKSNNYKLFTTPPPTGTMVSASVTEHDNGHWTECKDGTTHDLTETITKIYELYGVDVVINGPREAKDGDEITLVAKGFPDGGDYLWSTGEKTNKLKIKIKQNKEKKETHNVTYNINGIQAQAQIIITIKGCNIKLPNNLILKYCVQTQFHVDCYPEPFNSKPCSIELKNNLNCWDFVQTPIDSSSPDFTIFYKNFHTSCETDTVNVKYRVQGYDCDNSTIIQYSNKYNLILDFTNFQTRDSQVQMDKEIKTALDSTIYKNCPDIFYDTMKLKEIYYKGFEVMNTSGLAAAQAIQANYIYSDHDSTFQIISGIFYGKVSITTSCSQNIGGVRQISVTLYYNQSLSNAINNPDTTIPNNCSDKMYIPGTFDFFYKFTN